MKNVTKRFVATLPLSLLLVLAACGQAPTASPPAPLARTAPGTGAAALRPLAVQSAQVRGWGDNSEGQTTVPEGLTDAKAIATGYYHSLALKTDGTVVAWGANTYGGTTVPAGLTGVTAIAAGAWHSLALKADGTVVAWGYNNLGEATVPEGLTDVKAIAAWGFHSLALKTNGTVVAWGANFYGETTVPEGLTGVTAIGAGLFHSLALKSDGTVVAWGQNDYGQATVPEGLTSVKAIGGGEFHSLALKTDGTVVAWGQNRFGEGAAPAGLTDVKAISVGAYHNLALKTDGTVVAWGNNEQDRATVPTGLAGVTAIAAGGLHSLTLFDPTPPVITAAPSPATPDGQNGWYKTLLTVAWTVSDPESAVSARTGCDATLVADTAGQTLTCTATSVGGTASASLTVKVDTTKPTLAPALSSASPVLLGSALTVTPNAADATSGLASASCGTPDTSTVGAKTVTCTATDQAGNVQTASVPYQVTYAFRGFLSPVDNLPTVNTAKAGSAIPVKFALGGNQGLGVLAGTPTITKYACGSAPTDELESVATASNSGLQYDAASGSYTYVWKTAKGVVGCFQLNVKLVDGTSHLATFQLR